jgi:hypothetical protein
MRIADGRSLRKRATAVAISGAIDRAKSKAKNVGSPKLTLRAVAADANVAVATLYRFPDLLQEAKSLIATAGDRKPGPTEKRRRALLKENRELKRQVQALLSENLMLIRKANDGKPSPPKVPIDIASRRRRA